MNASVEQPDPNEFCEAFVKYYYNDLLMKPNELYRFLLVVSSN